MTVYLRVANTSYCLEELRGDWLPGLRSRARHHLEEKPSGTPVALRYEVDPTFDGAQPAGVEWPGMAGSLLPSGELLFERRRERVRVSSALDRMHVLLRAVGRVDEAGDSLALPSDSAMRVHQSLVLARSGGVLLHASGVCDERGALCFLGVSGQGKTTLARKLPEAQVLSDDQVAVLREDAGFVACSTPFVGLWGRAPRSLRAPLRALVFLSKKERPGVRTLSVRDARLRALQCAPWFLREPTWAAQWLASVAALAAAVPSYELSLPPQEPPDAWLDRIYRG